MYLYIGLGEKVLYIRCTNFFIFYLISYDESNKIQKLKANLYSVILKKRMIKSRLFVNINTTYYVAIINLSTRLNTCMSKGPKRNIDQQLVNQKKQGFIGQSMSN